MEEREARERGSKCGLMARGGGGLSCLISRTILTNCSFVLCVISALDGICAKNGAFPMDVIGLITVSVLKGLSYLYTNHKIVHRGKRYPGWYSP